MSEKGRVLMAMSGGIDSSIAALLLHEQGYELIGVTLKTWDYVSACPKKDSYCCSIDSINDAKEIADKMGFKHYVIDVREEFNKFIIENFVDEYLAGRTPNPCVLCNTHIKWGLLLKEADILGCEFISTGHYARVREENNRYILYKGVDETKDQSYFLWGLTQDYLKRTIFPLGSMHKQEIRKLADGMGYYNLTEKRESYEICFIPDNDYQSFLNRNVDGLSGKYNGGNFISTDGKIIGKHKGFPFYTIGQRKGLNIATGIPQYVININPESNTIVLGTKNDLTKQNMIVGKYNMVKYAQLPKNIEVLTKIRYKDKGTMSNLIMNKDQIQVIFKGEVNAIAPGQSAVFYEKEDVVAGGIIIQ